MRISNLHEFLQHMRINICLLKTFNGIVHCLLTLTEGSMISEQLHLCTKYRKLTQSQLAFILLCSYFPLSNTNAQKLKHS